MENIRLAKTPELIDLLSEETALYTKLHSSGGSHEEFERCRQMIKELQQEIELRKEGKTNQDVSDFVET
jgi:hypothetical protein